LGQVPGYNGLENPMIKFQKHVATTDPNTRSPASIQCDEILKGQDGGDDDEFMNEQDQELDM